MEYGTIERELHVDASPEVVFEVITSPEHIRDWWNAETEIDPTSGAAGRLVWHDAASGRRDVVQITVVDADPPRLFSFRWVYDESEAARPGNSLLVTFRLTPSGSGTAVRLTETGFREKGWAAAVLEEQYNEHSTGWDRFLPSIRATALRLVASR